MQPFGCARDKAAPARLLAAAAAVGLLSAYGQTTAQGSRGGARECGGRRWTRCPEAFTGFDAVGDDHIVYVAGGSPKCGGGSSDTLMLFTLPAGGTN